jgi:outer membrane lipoprotein-sorting protein
MTDERADRGTTTGVRILLVGVLAVVAVGAAVGATGLASDDLPDGETVLNNSAATYENATTVVGAANVTVANGTDSRNGSVEFATADPNLTRVSLTANGSTVVAGHDGNVTWLYDADNGTVRIWNDTANASNDTRIGNWSDGDHPVGNWSTWNGSDWNYTAETEAVVTVGGTEAYRVGLAPENDSVNASGTVWIATDDWRVLRAEYARGANTTTVVVTETRFNVSVHESTFSPPSNATPVSFGARTTYDSFAAAQAATNRTLPTLTADGYEFENASVASVGERTVAAATYANETVAAQVVTLSGGDDALPAGTNVTVDGRSATAVTRGDRTAVYWRDTDPGTGESVTRAVVAPLSVDGTVALAESVELPAESDGG